MLRSSYLIIIFKIFPMEIKKTLLLLSALIISSTVSAQQITIFENDDLRHDLLLDTIKKVDLSTRTFWIMNTSKRDHSTGPNIHYKKGEITKALFYINCSKSTYGIRYSAQIDIDGSIKRETENGKKESFIIPGTSVDDHAKIVCQN